MPNLPVLMFVAHRHVEARVHEALVAAGFDDITPAQSRVVQRIAPQGSRLTALAEQARITKQSAGALVDQLERLGYVERVPDPTDARARLVRIAARGQRATAVGAAVVAAVEREWRAHLGDAAYRGLEAAMAGLREITDPQADG